MFLFFGCEDNPVDSEGIETETSYSTLYDTVEIHDTVEGDLVNYFFGVWEEEDWKGEHILLIITSTKNFFVYKYNDGSLTQYGEWSATQLSFGTPTERYALVLPGFIENISRCGVENDSSMLITNDEDSERFKRR